MKKHLLFFSVISLLLFLLVSCENECIHTDSDKDHKCDSCGIDYTAACTEHTDTDKNHKCDYCDADYTAECTAHTDADKNKKCDYCGLSYYVECTNHSDNNNDHTCDNCFEVIIEHYDIDKDHKCDTCGVECTVRCIEHTDDDKNNSCDYCGVSYTAECSEHADDNDDHKCDYCEEELVSEHYDKNLDHICDLCGVYPYTGNHSCFDGDTDHICDYCNKELFWLHVDGDKDHKCDRCGVDGITSCIKHIDIDENDKCDYCEKYCGDSKYRIWANGKLIDKSYLMNLIPSTNDNPFAEDPKIYYGVVVPAIPIFEAFGALIEEKSDDIIEVTMNGATLIINKSDLRMINKETGADETYADPGGFGYFEIIDGEVILSDVLLCQVAHYVFGVEIRCLSFEDLTQNVFYQVVE